MSVTISQQNTAYVLPQDVFLLSYPRSGNTWLRQMLTDVYFQQLGEDTSDSQFLIDHFFTASPSFEKHNLADFPRPALNFFLLKTHDATVAEQFRFIYIYREAEDAIVSYRRFLKKAPVTYMEEGLKDFCQKQITSWKKHTDTAINNASRGKFISYASLVENTAQILDSACRFCGLEPDKNRIEAAILHNTSAVQRERLIRVGGTAMADYSIATAKVGGNTDFLAPNILDEIRNATADHIAALNQLNQAN